MSSYSFDKQVLKAGALDKLIRTTQSWATDFTGLSTGPLTIFVARELTEVELASLTALITGYSDPAQFLVFDRTQSVPMHSHFVGDPDSVKVGDKYVMQTLIFANQNVDGVILDSIKTVLEFQCPNPAAFLASVVDPAYIDLEIFDVSRNALIATQRVFLNEIAIRWNTLAGTESALLTDVTWRSTLFSGISNKTCNYDCIWQFRGSTSHPETFTYRINALQYIFYTVE